MPLVPLGHRDLRLPRTERMAEGIESAPPLAPSVGRAVGLCGWPGSPSCPHHAGQVGGVSSGQPVGVLDRHDAGAQVASGLHRRRGHNGFEPWQFWKDQDNSTESFLIDGLIHSASTIVSGRPMGGKTTLIAAMVGAIAGEATEFMGQPVNVHGSVLVVSTDPGEPRMWGRRMATMPLVHDVLIAPYSGGQVWDSLAEQIEKSRPVLLVFDNALGSVKGDIRGNEPARVLLDKLDEVIGLGVPVALIAHSSVKLHEDDSYSKGPMGSTAYDAWDRLTVHIEDSGRDTKLISTKGNESPALSITADLQFSEARGASWALLESETKQDKRPRKAETNATRRAFAYNEIVGNEDLRGVSTREAIAEHLGVSKSQVQRSLALCPEVVYSGGMWSVDETASTSSA
jgi:hypothetical protein